MKSEGGGTGPTAMEYGGREAKQGMPPLTFGSLVLVLEMGMVVVRMVLDCGDDDDGKKKSCGFMVCSTAGLHDWVCSAELLCNDFRKL